MIQRKERKIDQKGRISLAKAEVKVGEIVELWILKKNQVYKFLKKIDNKKRLTLPLKIKSSENKVGILIIERPGARKIFIVFKEWQEVENMLEEIKKVIN